LYLVVRDYMAQGLAEDEQELEVEELVEGFG
jgi:hypothetical protein